MWDYFIVKSLIFAYFNFYFAILVVKHPVFRRHSEKDSYTFESRFESSYSELSEQAWKSFSNYDLAKKSNQAYPSLCEHIRVDARIRVDTIRYESIRVNMSRFELIQVDLSRSESIWVYPSMFIKFWRRVWIFIKRLSPKIGDKSQVAKKATV